MLQSFDKSVVLLSVFLPWTGHAHSSVLSLIPNSVKIDGVASIGHANKKGGGELSSFGRDFLANGKTWDVAFCMRDSDGDGQYNGLELGDPCCEWNGSAPPPVVQRKFSHPGDVASTVQTKYRSTSYDADWRALVLAASRTERRRLVNMRGVSCEPLPPQEAGEPLPPQPAGEDPKPTSAAKIWFIGNLKLDPFKSKKLMNVIAWTLYVAVMQQRRRELGKMLSPMNKEPIGDMVPRDFAVLFCISLVYTEFASATMHLSADNEAFSDLPLFGPLARSFQWHHRDPTGIVRMSWIEHMGALDVGMVILLVWALCNPRAKYLGIFALMTMPMMYLMMATHRWTHCAPSDIPAIVRYLQRSGVLLTPEGHSTHHADYEINFSLLTGWSNPIINVIGRIVGVRAYSWMYIFVSWVIVVPVALVVPHLYGAWPHIVASQLWRRVLAKKGSRSKPLAVWPETKKDVED